MEVGSIVGDKFLLDDMVIGDRIILEELVNSWVLIVE